MGETIIFERRLGEDDLKDLLKNIVFRGVYDEEGNPLRPYKDCIFSLVKVLPPQRPTSFPMLMHKFIPHPLFTAQPTIYKTQSDMMQVIDEFLQTIGKRICNLQFEGIQYQWEGRGRYHVLPPIIEKHTYPLDKGAIDIKKIAQRFKGTFVKDARGTLHELSKPILRNFFVDKDSSIPYYEAFNPSVKLINYGLRFKGDSDFYIICDGSHRMDYALEYLDQPITAILVEGPSLLPYYALPMPFRPATRLTSKRAEYMYPRIDRDKIHLMNGFLKKALHYDWVEGGLHVSKLRSKPTIH